MLTLHHHRPTIQIPDLTDAYSDTSDDDLVDIYSSDEFRMYSFKVRRCSRGRPHDWTDCPFAHPGEKARRRDPLLFHYSAAPCPHYKKTGTASSCPSGDSCEFAHGVFECWLHPSRYRTQPCKDGVSCRRRVCFFAHTPDQLRVLSPISTPAKSRSVNVRDSYDGSPMRMRSVLSPTSVLDFGSAPADGLAMLMRRMRLTPAATAAAVVVVNEGKSEESESFDGLDVGWISELIK